MTEGPSPRRQQAADSQPDIERLLEQTQLAIDHETGVLAWLRSRPTAWRRVVGAALGLLVPLGYAFARLRVDLGLHPVFMMVGLVLLLALMVVALVLVKLDSLGRPSSKRGPWALMLLAVVAVALPPLLAPAHVLLPASLAGDGADFWPRAGACFAVGSLLGLGALALVLSLDRAPGLRATVAGGVVGLVGMLALQLHCPIVHADHLWLGHAAILYVACAVAGLIVFTRARLSKAGGTDTSPKW